MSKNQYARFAGPGSVLKVDPPTLIHDIDPINIKTQQLVGDTGPAINDFQDKTEVPTRTRATASVTIGGTPAEDDEITISITLPGAAAAIDSSVTLGATPTVLDAVIALANEINANADLIGKVTATIDSANSQVDLTYLIPGKVGNTVGLAKATVGDATAIVSGAKFTGGAGLTKVLRNFSVQLQSAAQIAPITQIFREDHYYDLRQELVNQLVAAGYEIE